MILDALKPDLDFFVFGSEPKAEEISPLFHSVRLNPFVTVEEDPDGKISVQKGVKVPDYNKALFYYEQDNPYEKSNPDYRAGWASEKIKKAYGYLWDGFKPEIIAIRDVEFLRDTYALLELYEHDIPRYEGIKRWIYEEREDILKRPENVDDSLAFLKFMDSADHILALLACLEEVCQIIENSLDLISNQIRVLEIAKTAKASNCVGFESYLVEKHRAKLMPFLEQHYKDKKTKAYVPMLFALEEYMETRIDRCVQKELHTAWATTFGKVGGYRAFNTAMQLYSNTNDSAKQQKIKNCKKLIATTLR
ncbi:hypothetical protein [Fibrisoma montanum]|nr:hypothetical protein [Fibrisoma montanum]